MIEIWPSTGAESQSRLFWYGRLSKVQLWSFPSFLSDQFRLLNNQRSLVVNWIMITVSWRYDHISWLKFDQPTAMYLVYSSKVCALHCSFFFLSIFNRPKFSCYVDFCLDYVRAIMNSSVHRGRRRVLRRLSRFFKEKVCTKCQIQGVPH